MSNGNITLNAVQKQLKAMKCSQYRLGIFDRQHNKMIIKDKLNFNQIVGLIQLLKFYNCKGKDIYITQANDIDRALLLVDDLILPQIEAMRFRGVEPACVVETSPENFQAWISLGQEQMPKPERQVAAKLLAEQFNGDMASTDANHFGRLAGFTNRKESHRTPLGFPFVKCREAHGRDATRSQEVRDWARRHASDRRSERPVRPPKESQQSPGGDPTAVFAAYFAEWASAVKASGRSLDISRGDFAVACRMLKEGYDREKIIIALILSSPNIEIRKKNHIEDYATRTVEAAERRIMGD